MLVSTIGVGLTFTVLMNPEKGLINQALAVVGVDGPGWLTNPSLALFSIALVDVWKGVGLATVIYIAGLVSIPGEYYEAAEVDGAGRWDIFRNIILPLARPATATVITLSLIGGLRSFDLIWAMTKGGPGFASDAISSVIFKQYQAGFDGLSTAGSVVLFLVVTIIVVLLDLVAQPSGGVVMRNYTVPPPPPPGAVIGVAAIIVTADLLRRPLPVRFRHCLQGQGGGDLLEFSWPTNFVLFEYIAEWPVLGFDYLMVIVFINSFILTVTSVAALVILSAMVAYVRQRPARPMEPGDQHRPWCWPD